MPTAVITGSTGGIGEAVSATLAADDWSLILVNRSQTKAEQQRDGLLETYPGLNIELIQTDLMDLEEVEASCREIADLGTDIHALYCIAGVLTDQRRLSAQDHESHYAVNVLANYVLMKSLGPLLVGDETDKGMIVTMSSSAIKGADLDIRALSAPEKIGGLMGAYAQSKLAMTAMCARMAADPQMAGAVIRAIDPGATKTPMTAGGDGMPFFIRWMVPFFFSDPEQQASKIVAAAEPHAFGGATGVFISGWQQKPLPKSIAEPAIQDELLAQIAKDCAIAKD
ncbi:MAG: SDR family NAD(P)-dependent oxidoreductase [Pseudomonadota bacterium]